MSDPPVNWGDPRTLDRLVWVVTAAPYRPYLLSLSLPDVAARIQYTASLLFQQFTLIGVALALWGFARLTATKTRLAVAFGLDIALVAGYAILYGSRDSFIYLLPAFALVLLGILYGAASLFASMENRTRVAALVLLAALPAYNAWANIAAMNLSADREAYDFAQGVFNEIPQDAVIFAEGDEEVFALTYYRYAVVPGNSKVVVASQSLLQFEWYYDNLRRAMPGLPFLPSGMEADFHNRAVQVTRASLSAGRKVCFTQASPMLPEFDYEAHGDLQCVAGSK
jgi:hypothetical protein